ncbi:hypothetical protein CK503_05745 [Aliifodinibius salipaludis]|uniref:DUF4292 domain-containing protein n=2 Tax=Fodinibius salipaludis TaxID=2032627 RepID=A0A2A2GDI0_9BACT|nr:hypothetical protein CK503_05745 [Aliifodinibius salipaludis]
MISCSSSQKLVDDNFRPSEANLSKTINKVPDYSDDLQSVEGKGRAIVSEPGNTERVTIHFASNRQKSLVTIRNGLGIEGGQLLTDGDTLLVYNKVDKYARKVPVKGASLNRINRLASLNILSILNYSIKEEDVEQFLESETLYQLQLKTGTKVYIDRQSHTINQIVQPSSTNLPYSKIEYSAYTSMKGFTLPRRISIFGPDRESKVALQLTALELNPTLDALIIELPDDIPIYHK